MKNNHPPNTGRRNSAQGNEKINLSKRKKKGTKMILK